MTNSPGWTPGCGFRHRPGSSRSSLLFRRSTPGSGCGRSPEAWTLRPVSPKSQASFFLDMDCSFSNRLASFQNRIPGKSDATRFGALKSSPGWAYSPGVATIPLTHSFARIEPIVGLSRNPFPALGFPSSRSPHEAVFSHPSGLPVPVKIGVRSLSPVEGDDQTLSMEAWFRLNGPMPRSEGGTRNLIFPQGLDPDMCSHDGVRK